MEQQIAATQEIARTKSMVSEDLLLVLDSVAGLTQLSAMSGGKPIGILMSAVDLKGSIGLFSA